MSGSFKKTDTIEQLVFIRDKDTGNPIAGLTDLTAKIINPDGTVLFASLPLIEVAELSGIYKFSIIPSQREQVGVYPWQVTSPTANMDKPLSGSFMNGILAGALAGSELCSILVRDFDTHIPIPDVSVSIFDSGGIALIATGKTRSDGYFVQTGLSVSGISLDPANYIIRLTKAMASFDPAYLRTVVVGGPNDFILEGRSLAIPPTIDPEMCRIYGNIKDLGLGLMDIDNVEILFGISPAPQHSGDIIITTTQIKLNKNTGISGAGGKYFNLATGDFYVDIARGLRVIVTCVQAGMSKAFTVPDVSSAKLISLIDFTACTC